MTSHSAVDERRGVSRQQRIEPRLRPVPSLREMVSNISNDILGNAVIVGLFAVTGPLVVAVSVAKSGGLSVSDVGSWIFAGYGLAGLVSVGLCAWYRQPIVIPFSLPAAVLIGPALGQFGYTSLIGTFLVTGLVITLLGVTGWFRAVMAAVPLPVVMSMSAGVFLPFVLRIIDGFDDVPLVALAAVAAFVAASCIPRVAAVVPPILAALVAGAAVTLALDNVEFDQPLRIVLAEPVFHAPSLNASALAELVLPLTIVVLTVGNATSFGILRNSGYDPPNNAITTGCGLGSIAFGLMGSPPLCNPGIVTGLLNRSGPVDCRYLGGIVVGLILLLVGIFAPVIIDVSLAMPAAFIGILAGLALFSVLQNAFVSAFASRVPIGALVAFLVTVSGVAIFGIGAPFWGLTFGCAASWILERGDAARS